MSSHTGTICVRCGGTNPRPGVLLPDGFHIHRGCRTGEEQRALRHKPFPPVKQNGRANRSSQALWPGALNFNAQGKRFLPEDIANPLDPKPTPGVGPQPWHADATYFREEEGLTVRECARMCGVSFSTMQKFLNPESKAKAKKRQAEYERAKRHTDPEHAQRTRDYMRRFAQAQKRKAEQPTA